MQTTASPTSSDTAAENKTPSASINPEMAQHPNNFYRCQHPDKPLRPAPAISARYSATYEGYRRMMFADCDYQMKMSAAEFDACPATHRWMDAEWEGDYTSDQLALWMRQQPNNQGRKLFEQALENGIDSVTDAPDIMKAFFAQVDAIPQLFDLEKAQKGADLLANMSPLMHYMANTSLIWVSSTMGPVSRMVGSTGRFFNVENSLSRFVETSSYVVGDVSSADVFQRNSQSFKTGVRVRLMHSLIRNQVIKSDNKDLIDFAERGHPMSDHIGANGGFMFTLYCLKFSASMGAKYSREDYENCCELARVISYINGTGIDVLPKDLDECYLYVDHSLAMCEGHTPFTEKLNQAFYFGIPDLIAKRQNSKLLALMNPLSRGFLNGINRWAYGNDIFRDMPGMPKQAFWAVPLFVLMREVRRGYLLLDKLMPLYEQRMTRRRQKHREFSNKKFVSFVAKLMKREGSDEVKMTYDGHDNSTTKDLKGADS